MLRDHTYRLVARWVHALLAAVCALVLSLACVHAAYANLATGSITLLLGDGSGDVTTDVVGGTIVLYQVATVDRPDANNERFDVSGGQFATSAAVADIPTMTKAELDEKNADISSQLETEALEANVVPFASSPIQEGRVAFQNVPEGLYLLFQTELSKGGRKMHTFLMSVPGEDGSLDIVAEPKPGIYTPEGESPSNDPTDDPNHEDEAGTEEQADTTSVKAPSIMLRAPQTGDASLPFALVAMGGLAAVGLGVIVRARSRRDE